MGESTNPRTTLRFDRRIRLEFRGATITSDAGERRQPFLPVARQSFLPV